MSSELLVEALLQELLLQDVVDEGAWAAACQVAGEEADGDLADPVPSVQTFEDAMVLTQNRGLVVRLHDGSEYQVTIVRSRLPQT